MDKNLPTYVVISLIVATIAAFLSAWTVLRQRDLADRLAAVEADVRARQRAEAMEQLSRKMSEMLDAATEAEGWRPLPEDAAPDPASDAGSAPPDNAAAKIKSILERHNASTGSKYSVTVPFERIDAHASQPMALLEIAVDRDKVAAHGLADDDVFEALSAAIAAGNTDLDGVTVTTADGHKVPLTNIVTVRAVGPGPEDTPSPDRQHRDSAAPPADDKTP